MKVFSLILLEIAGSFCASGPAFKFKQSLQIFKLAMISYRKFESWLASNFPLTILLNKERKLFHEELGDDVLRHL